MPATSRSSARPREQCCRPPQATRAARPRREPPWPRRTANPASAASITNGCAIIPGGDTKSPVDASRMFRDQVEAAVSEPVLLKEITGEPLAPSMKAFRVADESPNDSRPGAADSSCRCRSRSPEIRRRTRHGEARRRDRRSCPCTRGRRRPAMAAYRCSRSQSHHACVKRRRRDRSRNIPEPHRRSDRRTRTRIRSIQPDLRTTS